MSIKHLVQEIEKGLKSPVYFLYADDPYLLKEASMMGARTVPEGERDFSLSVFDLDGVDEIPPFKQILDVVNTIPFMAKQQVVLIENMQELAKKDLQPLEHYISDPSPYSVLMLFHRGSPKAYYRELLKKMKTIPLDIRPQELPFWIKEKARQKGLEVTDNAVEYLLGAVGPDVGLISSELEKFTLIGKRRIDTGDIMGIVRGSNDYDAFDLVNALREKDPERALPVDALPSAGIALTPKHKRKRSAVEALADAFRALPVPVIGRISDGAFILDLRCLDEEREFIAQLGQLKLPDQSP